MEIGRRVAQSGDAIDMYIRARASTKVGRQQKLSTHVINEGSKATVKVKAENTAAAQAALEAAIRQASAADRLSRVQVGKIEVVASDEFPVSVEISKKE